MPLGANRTNLNTTGTSYRNGNPVTLPKTFGTPIDLTTKSWGNSVPTSGTEQNSITIPHEFGNSIFEDGGPTLEVSIGATNNGSFAGVVTTSPVDTTACDFLIAACRSSVSGGTLTDSLGNTWTQISGAFNFEYLFYAWNPIVNESQTFTFDHGSSGVDVSIAVGGFSGVSVGSDPLLDHTSSPVQSGATTVQASRAVTPSNTGDLVISVLGGLTTATEPASVDSGLSIPTSASIGSASGVTFGWSQAPDKTPLNPTWTIGSAATLETVLGLFKS